MPFVVAAGDVIEDVIPFGQMSPGQFLLDPILALEQPVHGPVQVVLIGIFQGKFRRQGRGVPEPGGGELGGGLEQTLNDHGQDQIALT